MSTIMSVRRSSRFVRLLAAFRAQAAAFGVASESDAENVLLALDVAALAPREVFSKSAMAQLVTAKASLEESKDE